MAALFRKIHSWWHHSKKIDPQPKNGYESYFEHSLTHDPQGL